MFISHKRKILVIHKLTHQDEVIISLKYIFCNFIIVVPPRGINHSSVNVLNVKIVININIKCLKYRWFKHICFNESFIAIDFISFSYQIHILFPIVH